MTAYSFECVIPRRFAPGNFVFKHFCSFEDENREKIATVAAHSGGRLSRNSATASRKSPQLTVEKLFDRKWRNFKTVSSESLN